ncbi:MAG: hypothetical protein ABR910_17575 [Acidobacteriaceae bacterium]|jgi:hypothetical protein
MKITPIYLQAMLAALLATPIAAHPQTPQQSQTLTIAGRSEQAPVVQLNGKSYVDVESLARIAHGSLKFQGSQIVLTLPGSPSAASAPPAQPEKTPQLSGGFLQAEIEELTQIREWRAALVNAIENNYPVTDSWVARLRRSAEAKLQLATAAVSTDPDQKAALLLQNELTNMQQMSDQFLAMHTKANYIPPDSFEHNSLDDKILACSHALAAMAATKQYADEISCH